MDKVIIGVAGRMASGKGTVAKHVLQHYPSAKRFRSSDALRMMLDLYQVPQTRENLHLLSTFLRQTYGEDTIARGLVRAIKQSDAPIAVFDGIRREVDIQSFRQFPSFYFIYVDVDARVRYERYISRNENVGDAELSYEEFIERDNAEPEQQVEQLRAYADLIIDNNGTAQAFEDQLSILLEKKLATEKTS